ncbi:MAG: protein-glutamate O-methyltransferase CheR [Rickettsiaceae bacterium]|jgi:chemotaxis protein methyltransferase CheR|nr:protein-glutamate O-methyltransferase CheR [Rickettsiaceae bacterium]
MVDSVLTPEDFNYFAQLIKDNSGISLSQDKMYLIESKLQPILKKHSLNSVSDLIKKLRAKEINVNDSIVDAMTINESSFFRDSQPFKNLEQIIIPEILKVKKTIRIWSAACSTGQEPYSIAMLIDQHFQGQIQYEIIATDISDTALARAEKGIFTQFEAQRGMPINLLVKYFKKIDDNNWQIDPKLGANIKFSKFNLQNLFSSLGTFDVVFCRNVLIYFEQDTKKAILDKIASILNTNPPGYLILGGGETILGLSDKLKVSEKHLSLYTLK